MTRITTWNINSIRIRLQHIAALVKLQNPDILCLQETKVDDPFFPLDAVRSLGFEHVIFSGQKSYNGVMIASKIPLSNMQTLGFAGLDHKRHIAATLPDGTELHNFYIPAGGDIPDPVQNPSYASKLQFVEEMNAWAAKAVEKNPKLIIVGDFNIAPMEHDVWSSKQLRNVVSHTEPEITRLNALKASLNWCDVGRHFTPDSEKLYSWWSYRNRDWQASNRGRRLDHIWVTPPLIPSLKAYHTLADARSWESPSDHIPISVDIVF